MCRLRDSGLIEAGGPAKLDATLEASRPPGSWGPMLRMLLFLPGAGVYGMSSLWLVLPVYLEPGIRAEWLSSYSDSRAKQLYSLPSTLTFAVFAVGGLVLTNAADTWGRKPATVASGIGALFLGASCAAASSFPVFVTLRALIGFPLGGMAACAYVWIMEWARPEERSSLTTMLNTSFS